MEILARQFILARAAGQPQLLSPADWADYREMAQRFQYWG